MTTELELSRLELRYLKLRKQSPHRDGRLLASLSRLGQQVPAVVVATDDGDGHVLIDGYRRVRALRRLHQDTVRVTCWDLDEAAALLLWRQLRGTSGEAEGPLEQGWVLCELRDRFGMKLEELARRFDKSESWVSRRLALVAALPEPIQEQVQRGEIIAHAAMKYLVPLARANRAAAIALAAAIGPRRLSSRQVGLLYTAWISTTDPQAQKLLLSDPWLFLQAHEQAQRIGQRDRTPAEVLLGDFGALGGIAQRLARRLREGAGRQLTPADRAAVRHCAQLTRVHLDALATLTEKELADARPEDPRSDPAAR
jgi:ParB family transcriptional regulator, chromosome partitioning protein